jgi:ribonuclease HII
MKYLNLSEERRLWKRGYKMVAGLDEAGRGPLAGPVVAAAVSINSRIRTNLTTNITNIHSRKFVNKFVKIRELKDSKKLSPKAREKFYKILTRHPGIEWGIGKVSEKVIDKINILEATKLAMKKAIEKLKTRPVASRFQRDCYGVKNPRSTPAFSGGLRGRQKPKIDYLILDGKIKLALEIPQKSIVKADGKVFSCAAASVISKVIRDGIMRRYHQKYPQYSFARHKGYPTKHHLRMLKKYGPCKIHRKSFGPVKKYCKK